MIDWYSSSISAKSSHHPVHAPKQNHQGKECDSTGEPTRAVACELPLKLNSTQPHCDFNRSRILQRAIRVPSVTRAIRNLDDHTDILSRPPGMPTVKDVTDAMRKRQRENPNRWTLSMQLWCDVLDHCIALREYAKIKKKKGHVTLYDVSIFSCAAVSAELMDSGERVCGATLDARHRLRAFDLHEQR